MMHEISPPKLREIVACFECGDLAGALERLPEEMRPLVAAMAADLKSSDMSEMFSMGLEDPPPTDTDPNLGRDASSKLVWFDGYVLTKGK